MKVLFQCCEVVNILSAELKEKSRNILCKNIALCVKDPQCRKKNKICGRCLFSREQYLSIFRLFLYNAGLDRYEANIQSKSFSVMMYVIPPNS